MLERKFTYRQFVDYKKVVKQLVINAKHSYLKPTQVIFDLSEVFSPDLNLSLQILFPL